MTMEEWAKHLDLILQANGNALLQDAGKISAEIAKRHAEGEYEKYRVIQDKLFQNDLNLEVQALEQGVIVEVIDAANVDNQTKNKID